MKRLNMKRCIPFFETHGDFMTSLRLSQPKYHFSEQIFSFIEIKL